VDVTAEQHRGIEEACACPARDGQRQHADQRLGDERRRRRRSWVRQRAEQPRKIVNLLPRLVQQRLHTKPRRTSLALQNIDAQGEKREREKEKERKRERERE
jgi:hypothetical protein